MRQERLAYGIRVKRKHSRSSLTQQTAGALRLIVINLLRKTIFLTFAEQIANRRNRKGRKG